MRYKIQDFKDLAAIIQQAYAQGIYNAEELSAYIINSGYINTMHKRLENRGYCLNEDWLFAI